MKHWMLLTLAIFVTNLAQAQTNKAINEENLYLSYQALIQVQDDSAAFYSTPEEQKLFVDALWDMVENDENPNALAVLKNIQTYQYELLERLRINLLRIKYSDASNLAQDLVLDLRNALLQPSVDTRLIYTIAAYESDFISYGHESLIELARLHPQFYDVIDSDSYKEMSANIISDLFYNTPDTTLYKNGEYEKSVKIFMFCRKNRLHPCLMVMRDIHGEAVRNDDGALWTHPALASSVRDLPSYTRNGNTPTGIHTIDSVMPSADQQLSFGKYRRMILNFVPKSHSEDLTKALLPASSHNQDWWQPASVARDAGRNLFRIHGTGRKNTDPLSLHYPFMRTNGCVSQRENTYEGVTYADQKELLEDIMKAMDMIPSYSNHVNVKGFLYIMEIDNEEAPVTSDDLILRGIE